MTASPQVSVSPSEAPPVSQVGVVRWVRERLFSSWGSAVLTFLALALIYGLVRVLVNFLQIAEWEVVSRNLTLFAIGQFPREQGWRTLAALEIVWGLGSLSAFLWMRPGWQRAALMLTFPLWAAYRIAVELGNPALSTSYHVGLQVFLVLCIVIGVLAAWRGWRVATVKTVVVILWLLSPLAIQVLLAGIKSAPTLWFSPLTNTIILELVLGAAYFIMQNRVPGIARWILRLMAVPLVYFVLFTWVIRQPIIQRFGYSFYYPPAVFEALPAVRTQLWSGLLLTLILTVVGIVGSFPLGLLLALGRRSDLPILKWICTAYIELFRGVPLVTILFMAQVMLPLFLESNVDVVMRAMVGIIIFFSAYMAENVRGGLQAISGGQIEAAQALGLNAVQVTGLIVLPQALRIVIPAIIGLFISLFKDTTLVSIVTLLDLLGIAKAAISQDPAYQFHKTEVYLFIAAIYFVVSYFMASAARRIESATSAMGGTQRL